MVNPFRSTVLRVTADDVTVDLNGFTIDGSAFPASNGIRTTGRNVTIRNGTVRNAGNSGVAGGGEGTVVEGVNVHDCGAGIEVTVGGRISGCTVRDVQNDGITAEFTSTVTDCTVVRAGLSGGGWGIIARDGSTVTGCTVRDSPDGIQAIAATTVDRCAVTSNFSVGIMVDIGSTARGCTARFNNTGFLIFSSSVIDCTAHTNFLYGFEGQFDASIDRCAAFENIGSGYWIGDRGVVTNNRSLRDAQSGIGAGFEATGVNARISNNTASESANDNFLITGTINTVYANSATAAGSGTNYNFLPANDVAPITPAALSASGNENISN